MSWIGKSSIEKLSVAVYKCAVKSCKVMSWIESLSVAV